MQVLVKGSKREAPTATVEQTVRATGVVLYVEVDGMANGVDVVFVVLC